MSVLCCAFEDRESCSILLQNVVFCALFPHCRAGSSPGSARVCRTLPDLRFVHVQDAEKYC